MGRPSAARARSSTCWHSSWPTLAGSSTGTYLHWSSARSSPTHAPTYALRHRDCYGQIPRDSRPHIGASDRPGASLTWPCVHPPCFPDRHACCRRARVRRTATPLLAESRSGEECPLGAAGSCRRKALPLGPVLSRSRSPSIARASRRPRYNPGPVPTWSACTTLPSTRPKRVRAGPDTRPGSRTHHVVSCC